MGKIGISLKLYAKQKPLYTAKPLMGRGLLLTNYKPKL
ncbi:hypothetical protein RG47T_4420 [Mucilaginibacter polytrichastri]|uniref:Uncharacterized protein n=1 Tax=Mucilaginibacter polytrichastri TaxID=1302689 RepID=A0A1Q6A4L3_9SPHI|nr:hypothetical protein RG47T_4420 [Mucilaginibacter polytrichastri]